MRWRSCCPTFPRFPAPILIVQHMPPAFTRFLAQRLSGFAGCRSRKPQKARLVSPGKIVGGAGRISSGRIEGTRATDENSDHAKTRRKIRAGPSVDVLFRSVAQSICQSGALAIVLTGMGQDGLRGCEHLAAAGAEIVVQDEATSVVWGMPGFVARAGLADAMLPICGYRSPHG